MAKTSATGLVDRYSKAIAARDFKGVERHATIAEGDDVAMFYVLDTSMAKATVAEWYTVSGGKIVRIRTYFDARPFARPN